MNKKRVNDWISVAYDVLGKTEIVKNGEIKKSFRGQISSFGSAVITGSLKSAVAFFSVQGGSESNRPELLKAMYYIITAADGDDGFANDPEEIFKYVCDNDTPQTKEKFIDAAIAVKLAMNLYKLT